METYVGRKFKTLLFPPQTPLPSNLSIKLIEACRLLAKKGLVKNGEGNVSMRYKEGCVITGGGCELGRITPKELVFVRNFDETNFEVEAEGKVEPSSETPMHWLIYTTFPKINAIVHAHDMVALEQHEKGRMKNIGRGTGVHPYGTLELAQDVAKCIEHSPYVIIPKHGVVGVGKNIDAAMHVILSRGKVQ